MIKRSQHPSGRCQLRQKCDTSTLCTFNHKLPFDAFGGILMSGATAKKEKNLKNVHETEHMTSLTPEHLNPIYSLIFENPCPHY